MPFWPYLAVLAFFSAFYKILTKTTFVRLLFLKLKQEKTIYKKLVDLQKSMFMSFETKTLKNSSSYFSFVLALKSIEAQMLFWSMFFKMH